METLKIFIISCIFLLGINSGAQESKAVDEFTVNIYGTGKPILLFPGFTCTSQVYDAIIPELSKTYQIHAFTFAGFGGTPAIETPWLPKIKDAVERYITQNNLEESVLIGHSMGGTLALWLSSERPSAFSKLIIVDALPAMGALMIPNYDSATISYDNPYNQRMIDMTDDEFSAMAKQMASSMSTNEHYHEKLQEWIEQSHRKTYVYGYTDLLKLDLRQNIDSIKVPVTILAATKPFGKEVAEKNYRDQYKNLSTYELIFSEDSGHFIMYDQPEWFESKIKKVLEVE